MPVVPFLIAVLLLAAAITGTVWFLVSYERGRRRGLLVGSVAVGLLAITGLVLEVPSLVDSVHLHTKVILITPGALP